MADLIGPEEAGKILDFSRQYVTRLLKRGVIPGQKVGQRWIIRREDVEKFKRAQRRNKPPA